MKTNEIRIWPKDESVFLRSFLSEDCGEKMPVLISLPGGGYHICAPNEGDGVAERFATLGYAGFSLHYSVLEGSSDSGENEHTVFPEPLQEVAAAISYIRANAAALHADPERIVLAGFSAGGHLAAVYGNEWCSEEVLAPLGLTPEDVRPNAVICGYGATELSLFGSMTRAVFGERESYTEEMLKKYSGKAHVGTQTPPTLLWHSVTDPDVPVQCSLDMAQALEKAGVPYELHLFGCGGHAYGLGDGLRGGAWVALADSFIRDIFARPQYYNKAFVASLGPFGG